MTKRLYLRTRQTDSRENAVKRGAEQTVRGQAAITILRADRWEQDDIDVLRSALNRMLVG